MTYALLVLAIVTAVAAVSLRRTRWAVPSLWASRLAYALLVLQAPLYFMARSGFRVSAPICEWTFGLALARHSLTKYPHIILFMLFFLLTYVQFSTSPRSIRILWSAVATIAMGLLVELAQGATGQGNCRMRDLIPDSVGALLGFGIVWAGTKLKRGTAGPPGGPDRTGNERPATPSPSRKQDGDRTR